MADPTLSDLAKRAARRAYRWISQTPVDANDIERQLQRIFGAWATSCVLGYSPAQAHETLSRASQELVAFEPTRYLGDPILALAGNVALVQHQLQHGSLNRLADVYSNALRAAGDTQCADMRLACLMLKRSGRIVPLPPEKNVSLPSLDFLLRANTAELIQASDSIARLTACGEFYVAASRNDLEIWPLLAASLAADWDIDGVTRLLRGCVYLGVADMPGYEWAMRWLLDQESGGRFGLIRPAALRCRIDPDDWRPYFDMTVGVLWALAEHERPGFMVH